MTNDLVCGLDVGTGGARAFAVGRAGAVVARVGHAFARPAYAPQPGWAEQDALAWWETAAACLRELTARIGADRLVALSVDSTSGTFVPVNADGEPLMPAMMYNDNRAKGLDAEVNAAAEEFIARLGYHFPPAFALVKLVWLRRERPDIFAAAHRFVHAADFLVGRLTGVYDATDTSNALKMGADPLSGDWPAFLPERLGIPLDRLPRLYRPGEKLGEVSPEAANVTGLRPGTAVIAGVTDGTANFLASGASAPGDWNVTIGTTIVIRGVSETLVRDPLGRFYCHRHPDGAWLPGGASNVGGEALTTVFGAEQLAALDAQAVRRGPSGLVVYPLVRRGERMPFVSAAAEGFVLGAPRDEPDRFAGYAEGVALVSAWSVEEAGALGAATDGEVFMTGGGAHGRTLGRALASVLGRPVAVPAEPDGAFGSALLAAAWAWYDRSAGAAQRAMIARAEVVEPDAALTAPLRAKLEELKAACRARGYLS